MTVPFRFFFSLLTLLLGLSFPNSSLYGQKLKPADFGIKSKKALALYLVGRQHAQRRERPEAIEAFEEALELEPEFADAHQQLGAAAYFLSQFNRARYHLEKAYDLDPEAYGGFYLAEAYFRLEKFEYSIPHYESYLSQNPRNKNFANTAKVNLEKARFAVVSIQDSISFQPENLGPAVNSPGDEYLPYLTADGAYLLFTSRRSGSTGGFNPTIQDYGEDFFFSEWKGGKWSPAKNLGPPVNTDRNEGAAAISQDGKMLMYTICNHPEGLGRCDIFYSQKKGNTWSKPQNAGPNINTSAWESQPCLSHDGKTVFFVSDRTGGQGGRDIWMSTLENGAWTAAQNLGNTVNTSGKEGAPFMHADGESLYFASDTHPGFGSMDLFVSYRNEDGWTQPKNLGYPLNSVDEEGNIFISTKGDRGFINSTRPGGLGKSDLYSFELDERIKPRIATFLKGIVRDSLTQTPLYAKVKLVDIERDDTVRTVFSDEVNGDFMMSLPLNRAYAALVEAPGYLFASKHFYLKDLKETPYYEVYIDMQPIRKGAQVVLNNIFFDTGKWDLKAASFTELNVLLSYLEKNPGMQIELQGHTDDVGSEQDNLTLSQNRANAVKDYLLSQGITPERLLAKGYGETRPLVPNDGDENRAINRRTEFKVLEIQQK